MRQGRLRWEWKRCANRAEKAPVNEGQLQRTMLGTLSSEALLNASRADLDRNLRVCRNGGVVTLLHFRTLFVIIFQEQIQRDQGLGQVRQLGYNICLSLNLDWSRHEFQIIQIVQIWTAILCAKAKSLPLFEFVYFS